MLYFSAWVRFLGFAVKQLLLLRWPLSIANRETLGRALFRGHTKWNKKDLQVNACLINAQSEWEISLSRLFLAPRMLFVRVFLAGARRREIHFYGFGEIQAGDVRKLRIDSDPYPNVHAAPTWQNPFHAGIPLPPDREKDYYMEVARQMLTITRKPFARYNETREG